MEFTVKVRKRICMTEPGIVLAARSVETVKVLFDLDEEWSSYTKTVVFLTRTAGGAGDSYADVEHEVLYSARGTVVPFENLVPGKMYITLIGRATGGAKIATTLMPEAIRVDEPASTTGEDPEDYTPSILDQVLAAAGEAAESRDEAVDAAEDSRAAADEAAESAQIASEKADEAADSAQSAAEDAGKARQYSASALDSADIAAAAAETVGDAAEIAESLEQEIAEAQNVLGEDDCELEGVNQGNGVVRVQHVQKTKHYRPAILYTEQNLDPEDQAQARANIGAASSSNYVDTITPIVTSNYTRKNAVRGDGTIRLTYRDDIYSYFGINLAAPLTAGETYTLSFDCSGMTGVSPKPMFMLKKAVAVSDENGKLQRYEESTDLSDPFLLHDGRVIVTFTPTVNVSTDVSPGGFLLEYLRFCEADADRQRPEAANIQLSNFQIELGTAATAYAPSTPAVLRETQRIERLTHTYIEQSLGWASAVIDGEFVTASIPLQFGKMDMITEAEKRRIGMNIGLFCTDRIYAALPFPMRFVNVVGSCDRGGLSISSVNGIGGDASIGAYFRVYSPIDVDSIKGVVTRLMVSGLIRTPPAAPDVEYDEDIASEIVALAESYITSMGEDKPNSSYITVEGTGRRYAYGANILYGERADAQRASNGRINDPYGRAIMECDTFVGMCLRGIHYDYSPYNPDFDFPHATSSLYYDAPAEQWLPVNTNVINNIPCDSENNPIFRDASGDPVPLGSNGKPVPLDSYNPERNKRIVAVDVDDDGNLIKAYDQFMKDTDYTNTEYWNANVAGSMSEWTIALRAKMTGRKPRECYGRDIKYACDYSWMLWGIKGCIFSDPAEARPGDVVFYKATDSGRWFDSMSHCAIVGAPDSEGYMTIYEITGDVESGGRILQHVSLKHRNQVPAYFGRPYFEPTIRFELQHATVANLDGELEYEDEEDEVGTWVATTKVKGGHSYSAQLVADAGYTMVGTPFYWWITMDDENVTTQVYSTEDGSIEIPHVTGNVVVTIRARRED